MNFVALLIIIDRFKLHEWKCLQKRVIIDRKMLLSWVLTGFSK